MKLNVRHPRLQMYYDSTAMSMASLGAGMSLLFLGFTDSLLLPGVAMGCFLLFGVCYTIWYWTDRRKIVATNVFLSNVSMVYVVYAMVVGAGIVVALDSTWWAALPVCGMTMLCIVLMAGCWYEIDGNEKYVTPHF